MAISGGDGSIILTTKIDEKGLNDGMKSIRNGVLTIEKNVKRAGKAMAGAFVAAGTAAIKLGADFEQSAAKASTLFGDVAVNTDNLNKKMLELSSSTGVAATELNEALYSALSAGIPATEDMSEAIGILEGSTKLAKAGFTDIDTALSATAKTLNAYGLETTEAERIQGILIQTQNKGITTVGELGATLAQVTPTAAAFNVSFENVGAALATMTAQGTPTAQATTQLNSLIAELGKQGTIASNNLMKAAEGTKYAGMSFSEMTSSGASLGDILSLIAEEAEKNGVSMVDMFSSIEAGKAALSITSGEAQTFNSNLEAMADTSGLVDEAYGKVTQTFSSQTSILIESFKNLGIAIGTGGDVDMAIQNLSTSFGNFASVALPVVGQTVSGLLGAFMNLPTPILVVVGALGSLAAGITAYNTIATISSAITAAKAAVEAGEATTLWGAVAAQIGLNTAMLASPITWVVAGITALVAAFVILWNKSEAFRNFWIGLWEAIKTAVAPVIDWIKEAFSTAWDYIKAVWEQVQPYFSAIWEGIKAVFSVVVDVLGAYFETAWSAIKAVWNVVGAYFTMVWENIKAVFSVVKSVLSGDFKGAWEAIKSIWGNVKTFFSTVWENIKSVFSTAMSSFGKIGKNMIDGLWRGIQNAKNWLLGKIKEWCGSILNGIKSFFGIHSPSTVMRDEVGKMIPKGMAIGIDKAKNLVTQATNALVTDTRSEVQKVLDEMNKEMLESEKLYAEESIRLKDSTVEADKEYLDNLKKTAETERKLYDARQKDIENLKKNIVDAYSEMANEALSSIEDLEKEQQNLEKKLADYGSLMVEKTKKIRGKEVTYNVLADLDEQKETLQSYYDMLQTVKERANVPKEFFNVLREMGIDEGLEYANALLQLSDEDFAEYIKDWEEKQKFSKDISKALYQEEAEQLATEIGDKFDEVEKEFFVVGENSADEFEDGFIEQLQTVIKNIKRTISSAFSGITPDANYGISGYSINVPALARGSVLPGGKPFLAIVNDQPKGQTNVEAPLQTIVDAMNIALDNRGGSEIIREEHYNLNETELMTILHKLVKGGERLQGKSLISGGAY